MNIRNPLKLRLFIAIFLVWNYSRSAIAFITADVAGHWAEQAIIAKKKISSNILDVTCRIFADAVRRYPINAPFVNGVSFQLRTPCGRVSATVNEAARLRKSSEFNVDGKTIVFIGGWLTTPEEEYIEDMTHAFRCRGDNNFLVFDNGGFIVNEYMNAAYHTTILGNFVALGLQRLQVPAEKIHLIGHSLGAHIAGSAGRYYYRRTGHILGRITALDPARPCFRAPALHPRLAWQDAAFVDVIHSNPFDVGTEEEIGHVDFFPGGLDVIKPGCSRKRLMCSHELSIQYYLESIYPSNELNFMATRCASHRDLKLKSCRGNRVPMGYVISADVRGVYYLPVRSQWPYGVNARRNNTTFKSSKCGRCIIWRN